MNNRKYIEKLNGKLNIVGNAIKIIREQQGLSRQELSNKLMILGIDISSQSIFDIEKGTRTVVDYELCTIAKILDTTTYNLLKNFRNYLDNI